MKMIIAAAVLSACGAAVHAQALQDPTRPAPPQSEQLKAAPGGGAAASAQAQLQSVLIGRGAGGRRVAVISGQTMRVGDKFGNAVLVRISDNEVLLRDGKKLNVLKLSSVSSKRGISVGPGIESEP